MLDTGCWILGFYPRWVYPAEGWGTQRFVPNLLLKETRTNVRAKKNISTPNG